MALVEVPASTGIQGRALHLPSFNRGKQKGNTILLRQHRSHGMLPSLGAVRTPVVQDHRSRQRARRTQPASPLPPLPPPPVDELKVPSPAPEPTASNRPPLSARTATTRFSTGNSAGPPLCWPADQRREFEVDGLSSHAARCTDSFPDASSRRQGLLRPRHLEISSVRKPQAAREAGQILIGRAELWARARTIATISPGFCRAPISAR